MRNLICLLVVGVFWCSGCGGKQEQKSTGTDSTVETPEETLHRKARAAQMGNIIGYDGKKIQQNLDTIIDAGSKQAKEFEQLGQ